MPEMTAEEAARRVKNRYTAPLGPRLLSCIKGMMKEYGDQEFNAGIEAAKQSLTRLMDQGDIGYYHGVLLRRHIDRIRRLKRPVAEDPK